MQKKKQFISRKHRHSLVYILGDGVSTIVALFIFNILRYHLEGLEAIFGAFTSYLSNSNTLLSAFSTLLLALFLYWLSGYYNQPYAKSRFADFTTSLSSAFILSIVVFFFVVSNDTLPNTNYYLWLFIRLFALLFGILYLVRSIITYILLVQNVKPEYRRRILLIKEGEHGNEIAQWIRSSRGLNLLAEIELSSKELQNNSSISATGQKIKSLVESGQIEEVIIATQNLHFALLSPLLYHLYPLRVPIKLSPLHLGMTELKMRLHSVHGKPLINLSEGNMSQSSSNIKWLFDRIAAALALLLLTPLLAFIAWRVKKSSKGAIFYKQERIGYLGRPFMIYKFRSMYKGAEAEGPQLSQDEDPRITPFGRWIRRYRLDELPQLWNVLRGDMSFVGPRPERAYYINQIVEDVPQFFLLHNVRPGITSWAMVRYGYASSLAEMKERLSYDWLYYENMSLRLDVVILFYTIQTILKGSGK